MKVRFDQVSQMARSLRSRVCGGHRRFHPNRPGAGTEDHVAPLPTKEPSSALVVFNNRLGTAHRCGHCHARSDSTTEFDLVDESGAADTHQEQGLGTTKWSDMTMDAKGLISR